MLRRLIIHLAATGVEEANNPQRSVEYCLQATPEGFEI